MIETVFTVEEAEAWFLRHSEGQVRVERPDGTWKDCDNFPDAKAFLSE